MSDVRKNVYSATVRRIKYFFVTLTTPALRIQISISHVLLFFFIDEHAMIHELECWIKAMTVSVILALSKF